MGLPLTMICPCGQHFPSISPLPGGIGLGAQLGQHLREAQLLKGLEGHGLVSQVRHLPVATEARSMVSHWGGAAASGGAEAWSDSCNRSNRA